MLSIGQFSKICQVSIKTLHYYNKIGLVNPSFIDEQSGYRYYDQSQISAMLLIQRLKRYGFSLAEIESFMGCGDSKALYRKLERQKYKIIGKMQELALIQGDIEHHMNDLERTGDIMSYQNEYEVNVCQSTELAVICSRQMMSVAEFGVYYGTIYERIAREHLTVTGEVLAIYHDEEFNQENSDIELAVAIAQRDKADRILESCKCASTTHYGGYSGLPNAYGAVVKWIEANGRAMAGCPFEIYRKTQFDQLPPDQWVTDIYFPIR